MSYEFRTNQVIELLSVSAVVLSVLFLAYELRQANKIARNEANVAIRGSLASANEIIWANEDVALLFANANDKDWSPTETEEVRIQAFIRRISNSWIIAETAYNNGYFAEDDFQSILDDVRGVLSIQGFHPYWQSFLDLYPVNSQKYRVFEVANRILE